VAIWQRTDETSGSLAGCQEICASGMRTAPYEVRGTRMPMMSLAKPVGLQSFGWVGSNVNAFPRSWSRRCTGAPHVVAVVARRVRV
jgi:hypothetical protein